MSLSPPSIAIRTNHTETPTPEPLGTALSKTPPPRTEAFSTLITLRQVDIPVTQQEICERAYQHELVATNIINDMFCVGSNGCWPCYGDSGGPLIQFDGKSRPVVMGIVSGGVRCGDGEWPAMFARTRRFVEWMTSRSTQFTVSEDARQLGANGSAVTPSAPPSVVPNVAGEVNGANTGSITLFALVAVGAVAIVGLTLLWGRANAGASCEEVALESLQA